MSVMSDNGQRIRRPTGVKRIRRRDNQTTRNYLDLLEDQRSYFEDRIEKGDHPERANWDRQQAAALRWALRCCREWLENDPLVDVVVSGTPIEHMSLQDFVDHVGGFVALSPESGLTAATYELTGVLFVGKDPTEVRLTCRPLARGELAQRGRWLILTEGVKARKPTAAELRA